MADNDWLGGYTLEELLGPKPVTKTKKQERAEAGKRGFLSATLGAPFRIVGGLLKLPLSLIASVIKLPVNLIGGIVKLPFRMIGAVIPGGKKKNRTKH